MKEKNNIGRWVRVVTQGDLHEGTVIDQVKDSDRPKRVRLQTGKRQGEVLMPSEYRIVKWLDE